MPLHILRYATGNMQRVVFHSTIPSLLVRNSLLGSFWGLLENQLRNFSASANHYEQFRSRPEIFQWFSNTSEDFPKILKNRRNIWKTAFEPFPKFTENFRKFPNTPEDFSKILTPFWTVSEVFQKFPKIAKGFPKFHKPLKLLKSGFEAFPRFPSSSANFPKI